MEEVSGSLGTRASFCLRFGQTVCSTSALFIMCVDADFYRYTACWIVEGLVRNGLHCICSQVEIMHSFLVTTMGMVIPWSSTLTIVDACCIMFKSPLRQRGVTTLLIFGDWAVALLSLAAASSTASVSQILLHSTQGPGCPVRVCGRYLFSAAMALLLWCLSLASLLFNFWLLPKFSR